MELVADTKKRLRSSSPFDLMALASQLVELTTPRPVDRWPGAKREPPIGPSILTTFTDGPAPMKALALAVAVMHPDEALAERLRTEVGTAPMFRAPWLRTMESIEVTGTWLQPDVLGDGENILLGWRWPGGAAATAVVYVDHNMGTIVKDAFVIPESDEEVIDLYGLLETDGMTTVPLDPAAARARISEAIWSFERVIPPIESESWPHCRPMVEWVLRHLPEGGTGYERPDWPDADREKLLDDFLASPHAAVEGLEPAEVRELADPLVWFGCDYGPGDPLRWSPVSVEIALADWYPRKVLGQPNDLMERVPDVLAGFVRFAHERTGIAPPLTAETIGAVARWRRVFAEEIKRTDRTPFSHAEELARLASGVDFLADEDEADWTQDTPGVNGDDDLTELLAIAEAHAIELVGGPDAYATLTDEPLAEAAFDWDKVPPALRQPTAETLGLLDEWAAELFDTEVRTIARAVLAAVVATDRSVFKRSARTDSLAAAILGYLMSRLSGRLTVAERRELGWTAATQKDLAAATGVSASSISTRSKTIARVIDRADIDWPSILHSSQRREAVDLRENLAEWRETGFRQDPD